MNVTIGIIAIIVFGLLLCLSDKVSYRFIRYYNLFIVILLSIIAYCYTPTRTVDLYRLFSVLDKTRQIGAEYIFIYSDYANLPVASTFFYIISLLNNNHILPLVSCAIYYGITSNIIISHAQKTKGSKLGTVLSLMLFYFSSNYLGVISEIRNPLAISIFSFIVYKDISSKFKNIGYILVYIALCLLHPAMVPLLIIRMLLFINKRYDKITEVILLAWSKLKNIIISVLLLFSGNQFMLLIADKIQAYNRDEAYAVANVNLYTFVYLILYIVVLLLYVIIARKHKDGQYAHNKRLFVLLYCFCIGSLFEYHLFVRLSRLILFFGTIIIIDLFSTENNRKNKLLYTSIILITAIMFAAFYLMGQYQILIG